jgi:zinc/manganese transport system substrate-binding protein
MRIIIIMGIMSHAKLRNLVSRSIVGVFAAAAVVACGGGESSTSPDRPSVVVTYSILGAVVSEVVGDTADVVVLMPNGIDPHEWEPSAKDIELLNNADLIVSNGLDLEGNVMEAIEAAEKDGVAVFHATDHIEVIEFGAGSRQNEEDVAVDGEAEHDHGDGDPHFWTSPVEMAAVVEALGVALADIGIDTGDRTAMIQETLLNTDQEIRDLIADIPAESRILVTGHESLGYFAHEYEFEVVGAVIPSLSSEAEASAGDLATLKEIIADEGVSVIFTEMGTSPDVVEALAAEAKVSVVELSTHFLPEDGTYKTFILQLASMISVALQP